jgi:ATP-dependent DNA helicase DinG
MTDQTEARTFDLSLLPSYFPHSEFREGQRECIEKILNAFASGKRFVMLEAPTGAGKSAIGLTVSRFFDSAYYLTVQKILQSQIVKDFGSDDVVDLKGRNAYDCNYWDYRDMWIQGGEPLPQADLRPFPKPAKTIGCDIGVCKVRDNKSKAEVCFTGGGTVPLCPYWKRVKEAQDAHLAVMNFKSFLYQTTFSNSFGIRELIVIDECHRAEPELLDFISISIMDTPFSPLRWPQLETAEEYAEFIKDNNLIEMVEEKERYAKYAGKAKEADEWASMKFKLELFLSADSTKWVSLWKEIKDGKARILELKPIMLEDYAYKYLFDHGVCILMMSATILSADEMRKMLSIKKEECFAYKMKNRFPKQNRPIIVQNVGSMSFKNKAETHPKLVDKTTEICRRHKDQRGIIHTHNFEITKWFLNECPKDVKVRFLYQENFTSKEDMLLEHSKQQNSIIIAPAMHEGLDLKGDLSRFQIIAKVPYPSLGDNPQLKARMEMSPNYYSWLTALKIVQSYGRSVRSETDWAITYIIDSDFGFFTKRSSDMLPDWFTEAIKWPD